MPVEMECGENNYISKSGKIVPVENCSIKGSNTVLIFTNGTLSGVTGRTNKATAQKLAKAIGSSKAQVEKMTL